MQIPALDAIVGAAVDIAKTWTDIAATELVRVRKLTKPSGGS